MPAPSHQFAEDFVRTIKPGEPWLIESRCSRCGAIILGSVMNGLEQKEDAHRKQCSARGIAGRSAAQS